MLKIFFSLKQKILIFKQEDIDETAKSNSREEKELGNNTEDSCTRIDTTRKEPGVDLFNNEESDPMKTKALSKFLSFSCVHLVLITMNHPKSIETSTF